MIYVKSITYKENSTDLNALSLCLDANHLTLTSSESAYMNFGREENNSSALGLNRSSKVARNLRRLQLKNYLQY